MLYRNIIIGLILLINFQSCNSQNGNEKEQTNFEKYINEIRIEYNIPSLAAAVIRTNKIEKIAAVGIKKLGSHDDMSIYNKFHIGSCGNHLPGMLALMLVEKGYISWDEKPTDIFPELNNLIHKDLTNITFLDLMTHRAGIPSYSYWHEKEQIPKYSGTEIKKREKTSFWQLKQAAGTKPGEFKYSNMGYVIATSMMEKKTGKSWEELVEKYIFNPLDIKSFGYGRPALNDTTQPWGHWIPLLGQTKMEAVKPDEFMLQSIERPAGDTHLSIKDFAKYVQHHLRGIHKMDGIFKPDFFKTLHTIRTKYALGWGANFRNGEKCSIHYGSEATFFAAMLVFHETDLAIIVVSSSATPKAKEGVEHLIRELIANNNK